MSDSIYDFTVQKIDSTALSLSEYKGKVILIVNTASRCGFTPQYEGLEALYRKYRAEGFEILAFPCNQFLSQEPGDAKEIQSFCKLTYDTSFPLFAKIDVKGKNQHPLYRFLTEKARGFLGSKTVKWNFTKFLIDRNGNVAARYAPATDPSKLEADIEKLL
ncbi:MAG: glutathione peroxidase [Spirochaetota bacterium]